MRFEIDDLASPYELFVRELVAMDGKDTSEILLIDSRGNDTTILICFLCWSGAKWRLK